MIIDAHTHLGTHTVKGNVDDLLRSMDGAGIDKSLVFAGRLNGLSTMDLLKIIKPHQDRLYAVGSLSPDIKGRWDTNLDVSRAEELVRPGKSDTVAQFSERCLQAALEEKFRDVRSKDSIKICKPKDVVNGQKS